MCFLWVMRRVKPTFLKMWDIKDKNSPVWLNPRPRRSEAAKMKWSDRKQAWERLKGQTFRWLICEEPRRHIRNTSDGILEREYKWMGTRQQHTCFTTGSCRPHAGCIFLTCALFCVSFNAGGALVYLRCHLSFHRKRCQSRMNFCFWNITL